MKHLQLERPLVFFDLESTGVDPATDRIVEISVLRVDVNGVRKSRTRRLNPDRPIPPEATAVHGIRDEDVQDAPRFRQVARGLLEFLEDADLAGFNVLRFDVPLLERELGDCGLDLGLDRRHIVDAMAIFHRKERRDLSAAVRYYLERDHEDAHSAEADVIASVDVLDAQLARYDDLPRSVAALDEWVAPGRRDRVDRMGKFVRKDGEVVFAFGKHQGRSLRDVAAASPDYLEWFLNKDFPPDAQEIVRRVLRGDPPEGQST